MSKLGIDVSTYNGNVDWKTVKAEGYTFACIKIIKKDNTKDPSFDKNWAGCQAAGIDIYGVYNYSYATSVDKAIKDANAVINALGSRKTVVWLDVEDNCQKGLKEKLINIILAYKEVIEKSGNKFGIYTGNSFYNSYLKPYISKLEGIKFWIARYGPNNGKKNPSYQPQIKNMVVWQYTSKARLHGVTSEFVDCNVSYDDDWFKSKPTVPDKVNPYKKPTKLLKYKVPNMKGDDVKWVQYYLVDKGYLDAKNAKGKTNIDGVYGKGTEAAVIKFQKAVGIEIDGMVGAETRKYLKKQK